VLRRRCEERRCVESDVDLSELGEGTLAPNLGARAIGVVGVDAELPQLSQRVAACRESSWP